MESFKSRVRAARLRLIQMHYESRTGHIGGNLSCIDILMTLFHWVLTESDRFVLSKGHASGALYVTLWSLGLLEDDDLRTFHGDPTRLSGHAMPRFLPQIPFATGSLGHGLSLSSGMALSKQLRGEPGRAYCLLSDGEWQEGSTWEALIFAAHRKLALTLIIDTNGLQGFGGTAETAGQGPLTQKLEAFGISVVEIDGHDLIALAKALKSRPEGLHAIVARTRKGNGVSFMQDQMEWHYRPLSEPQYHLAMEEIASS